MVYQIKNTRGQVVSTVSDYGTDNSTSLELIGRGVSNYGLIEQSNLLHLLENFASTEEPTNPVEGQLWFNTSTSNQVLSVYFNNTWNNLITIVAGDTPPSRVIGLWVDTTSNTLFFASNGKWVGSSSFFVSEEPPTEVLNTGLTWLMIPEYILWTYDSTISAPTPSFKRIGGTNDGTYLTGSWRMIGTQYPINAGMKSYYASVPDTSSNFHDVIVTEIDNNIISVESKNEFSMLSSHQDALSNFSSLDSSLNVITTNPTIYSGITLNQSVPSNVFGGLALGIVNFDDTDVIGRGKDLSLRPTTPISDSTIDLGSLAFQWKDFYSNNVYASDCVYASNNMEIGGDNVATQPWAESNLLRLYDTDNQNVTGPVTFEGITLVPTVSDWTEQQSVGAKDAEARYTHLNGGNNITGDQNITGNINLTGNIFGLSTSSTQKWTIARNATSSFLNSYDGTNWHALYINDDDTAATTKGTLAFSNVAQTFTNTQTFSGQILVPDITSFGGKDALNAETAEGRYVKSVPPTGQTRIASLVENSDGRMVFNDGANNTVLANFADIPTAGTITNGTYTKTPLNDGSGKSVLVQSFYVYVKFDAGNPQSITFPIAYPSGVVPVVSLQPTWEVIGTQNAWCVYVIMKESSTSLSITNTGCTIGAWSINLNDLSGGENIIPVTVSGIVS